MRSAKKYSADATGAGAQRSVAGRSGAACGARGRSKRKRAAQSIHNADRGIAAGAAQYPERRRARALAQTAYLAARARLWQKLRIEAGWETALEAVLRERLGAF